MDFDQLIRGFLALLFVLGLIGGLTIIARKFGFTVRPTKINTTKSNNLSIKEVMSIDAKRKLVLVNNKETEHLLLIGEKDLVIHTGINKSEKII
ncbi:MAG: hypothetical protein CFH01_00712 [Alphaproteobacteria bacterium MarineAlpha2_Bin1]|nr:MAG: hypothetical protein CFH01_00712 [Alphaproteobacteria bacterium MarineAlpha2_Bin1]|tara:strand:+ start:733 stop:1014 length:282 start_codon:yes stop_codon:yes gene_type:complete